ncbi:recombinase family protein [Leptothoe sp. EHU-05/26/07-4]
MYSADAPTCRGDKQTMEDYPIGYVRASTDHDQQSTSIKNQEQRLREYGCQKIYIDRASGKDFARNGWLDLEEDVEKRLGAGLNVIVVVTAQDRIGRNNEIPALIGRLEKSGVRFYSLNDGLISVQDPESEFMVDLRSTLGKLERNRIRRKILKNKAWKRASNHRVGGNPIFGYHWVDDKLQIHPEHGPIARAMVDKFLMEKWGADRIRQWLKREHNIDFTSKWIRQWLKHPMLLGHTVDKVIDGIRVNKPRYNTHPAIITEAEHRAIIARKGQSRGGGTSRACSGLVWCKRCTIRLQLKKSARLKSKTYYYFRCHGTNNHGCPDKGVVKYELVEPLVIEAIANHAESIAQRALEPEEPITDPKVLELQNQIAQYQSLYEQMPMVETAQVITKLQDRLNTLRSTEETDKIDHDKLQELAQAMSDPVYWQGIPEADRNLIYRELGVKAWRVGNRIESVQLS